MEHQLTILFNANTREETLGPPVRVMVETDFGTIEDEGAPEQVSGKLLEIPDELKRRRNALDGVVAELGGLNYRFASLSESGDFELRKAS